jgi:hypothetical protein
MNELKCSRKARSFCISDISSSLDVIALFRIDQEQQDKLVQLCIAAIRYAEAACFSGTFKFIHISS